MFVGVSESLIYCLSQIATSMTCMSTLAVRPDEDISTIDIVAGNIRAEAARLGLTQVALGKALGISQGSITKRWKGLIPWQLGELDAVAEVLGVSVIDLVTPPRGGEEAGRPTGTRTRNPRIKSPLLYH